MCCLTPSCSAGKDRPASAPSPGVTHMSRISCRAAVSVKCQRLTHACLSFSCVVYCSSCKKVVFYWHFVTTIMYNIYQDNNNNQSQLHYLLYIFMCFVFNQSMNSISIGESSCSMLPIHFTNTKVTWDRLKASKSMKERNKNGCKGHNNRKEMYLTQRWDEVICPGGLPGRAVLLGGLGQLRCGSVQPSPGSSLARIILN